MTSASTAVVRSPANVAASLRGAQCRHPLWPPDLNFDLTETAVREWIKQDQSTNGLLRDYFPKGSDLRVYDADRLAEVAVEVNDRPRKTLGWATPAQLLEQFTREPTG